MVPCSAHYFSAVQAGGRQRTGPRDLETSLRCWQKQGLGKQEPRFTHLCSPGVPSAASQPRPEYGLQTQGKVQEAWRGRPNDSGLLEMQTGLGQLH